MQYYCVYLVVYADDDASTAEPEGEATGTAEPEGESEVNISLSTNNQWLFHEWLYLKIRTLREHRFPTGQLITPLFTGCATWRVSMVIQNTPKI